MSEHLSDQDIKLLIEEYKLVESKWRFFQTLRYGITAFTTGFHITLFGGFNYAYSTFTTGKSLPYFTGAALVFIPLLGVLGQTASMLVEMRFRQMYVTCSHRGAAIERQLRIPALGAQSIFIALSSVVRVKYINHTSARFFMILVIYVIWLYLFWQIGMIQTGYITRLSSHLSQILTYLHN